MRQAVEGGVAECMPAFSGRLNNVLLAHPANEMYCHAASRLHNLFAPLQKANGYARDFLLGVYFLLCLAFEQRQNMRWADYADFWT